MRVGITSKRGHNPTGTRGQISVVEEKSRLDMTLLR